MPLDLVPWLGLAAQGTGAALLAFSGGFGLGSRKRSPRGIALGLAVFCSGCAFLAVYAGFERHFLMTGAQIIAGVLVSLGVLRKLRDGRG